MYIYALIVIWYISSVLRAACCFRSIYHRDLRLENLHLHGSHFAPQLKITGFGYSKSALLDSQPKVTPPELTENNVLCLLYCNACTASN